MSVMLRSVQGASVRVDALVHYVASQRLCTMDDGHALLRVYFACGRRQSYRTDPHVIRAHATCLECWAQLLSAGFAAYGPTYGG